MEPEALSAVLSGPDEATLAATAVGLVATILEVGSYLRRERGGILAWQVASSSLWSVHFFLLHAETGMAMNLIGLFRQVVFFYRGQRAWANFAGWPWIIGALFIAGGAFFWDGIHSLLPLAAMLISTAAFWQLHTRPLRLLAMVPPPLWFAYNAMSGSWPGMLTEVAIMVSQITGFLRFDAVAQRPKNPAANGLAANAQSVGSAKNDSR